MSPHEWSAVLADASDDERRDALLMLADEDWLSEEGAAFLRTAARREAGLCPGEAGGRSYWFDEAASNEAAWRRDHEVPSWVVCAVGRVDPEDEPRARGEPNAHYTPYVATAAVAFRQLLEALAADGEVRRP